jgi:hypothetical protein
VSVVPRRYRAPVVIPIMPARAAYMAHVGG